MNPLFQRHLQIGRQFFAASSYARAAKEFEAALELDPDDNYARLLLARCYLNSKRPKDARRETEIALQSDPNDADAHYMAAFTAKNHRAALAAIDGALQLAPFKAAYHEHRAWILTRLQQYGPALESARRAVEIAPNSASAHRQVASVLFDQSARSGLFAQSGGLSRAKRDEAAHHVERALEIAPDSAYSQAALARLRGFDLEFEDSVEKWAEALRLNPTDGYAQFHFRRARGRAQAARWAERVWRVLFRPLPWPLRLPLCWGAMGWTFYWGAVLPRGHGLWSGEPLLFILSFPLGAMQTPLLLRDWLQWVPDRYLGAGLYPLKKPPLK